MSSYASRHQGRVSDISSHSNVEKSTISDKSQTTDGPSMQQIRIQTLRRRKKFKEMQERERLLEEKKRQEALLERKKRIQALDPRAHDRKPDSKRELGHINRKRPTHYQQKVAMKSNNQHVPSVMDSTQIFEFAEKLVNNSDVTTSHAVNMIEKKSAPSSVISNPANRRRQGDNSDVRQRLIGQKFKLKPIEVSTTNVGTRRRPALHGQKATSFVNTPSSPSTVITNVTTQSEPFGRNRYKDTSSILSSNYDNDLESVTSLPTKFHHTRKASARPWRQKPVVPVRKDFETGFSIEISNVEKSINNLDKALEQRKARFLHATKERKQWLLAEEKRMQKEKIEQENKARYVQSRIPHEDYEKYIPSTSDSEEEIEDEVLQHTQPESQKGDQGRVTNHVEVSRNDREKRVKSTTLNNRKENDLKLEKSNEQKRSGLSEINSRNLIPKPKSIITKHASSGKVVGFPNPLISKPESQGTGVVGARRMSNGALPSSVSQKNQMSNLSRQPSRENNSMLQLDSQATPRNTSQISTLQNTSTRIHTPTAMNARPGQNTSYLHGNNNGVALKPAGSTLRDKEAKGTGLVLRRFTSNPVKNAGNPIPASTIRNVVDLHVPSSAISNSPTNAIHRKLNGSMSPRSIEFGDSINDTNGGRLSPIQGTEYSFMENSVVLDDDIPDIPMLSRYSFGIQNESNVDTVGGGQINVQDSKALQFLGLA